MVFPAAVLGALTQALVARVILTILFGLFAIVVLAREFGIISFNVPQNARLVPEHVQYRGEVGALQFGFEMGTGMRTYSPSALPHLALLSVIMVVPFGPAFLIGAGFAVGRLIMPLLSNAHSDDGSWTRLWHANKKWSAPLLSTTMVLALLVAVTAI